MTKSLELKKWFNSGEPWVWLNAAAVSASMIMVFGLLALIAYNGLGHFWPAQLMEAELLDNDKTAIIIGEIRDTEIVPAQQIRDAGIKLPDNVKQVKRILLKQGNRDLYGLDFRWILEREVTNSRYPKDLISIERREWGNLYGRLVAIKENGKMFQSNELYSAMQSKLAQVLILYEQAREISVSEIGAINYRLEKLRLKERKLQLDKDLTDQNKALNLALIEQQRQDLNQTFELLQTKVNIINFL